MSLIIIFVFEIKASGFLDNKKHLSYHRQIDEALVTQNHYIQLERDKEKSIHKV